MSVQVVALPFLTLQNISFVVLVRPIRISEILMKIWIHGSSFPEKKKKEIDRLFSLERNCRLLKLCQEN